ncbi:MAG: hypothetical protein NT149_04645 [Candidatus Gottesmanbacteria bacterium]|nr:hypothetical protein [Candidatus Gottesmanbacteria bacterium]
MAVINIDARIIDKNQARVRLEEIGQYLSPEDQTLSIMTDQEREQTLTSLRIENIWLRLKLEIITPAEKERSLAGIFKELKKKPDVNNWLFAEDQHGLSMVVRIRDKVMPPPIYVGRYFTKR